MKNAFGVKTVLAACVLAASVSACNRETVTASDPAPVDVAKLAPVATDDIAKDPALLTIAMNAGKTLYEANCSSCHGADLKGVPAQHAPSLADDEWMYTGDDLDSGGIVHKASDVERTILNGIRAKPKVTNLARQSDNDKQNLAFKNIADMPAMGPTSLYGLSDAEMADVAEYTLQLSGQDHNAEMSARGKAIFAEKGGCYDCHAPDGTGNQALGSTNLTKPELYLYGTTREAILASIKEGRAGVSPAFDSKLKPEETKALAVYVFSQGGPGSFAVQP